MCESESESESESLLLPSEHTVLCGTHIYKHVRKEKKKCKTELMTNGHEGVKDAKATARTIQRQTTVYVQHLVNVKHDGQKLMRGSERRESARAMCSRGQWCVQASGRLTAPVSSRCPSAVVDLAVLLSRGARGGGDHVVQWQ